MKDDSSALFEPHAAPAASPPDVALPPTCEVLILTSAFSTALAQINPTTTADRRWVFVPYDQLCDELGVLRDTPASALGIILIENTWKGRRRPYHKQKLALILSNMRHFAIEQAHRGVAVRYEHTDRPYRHVLSALARELGPIEVMEPAEYELRVDLAPLIDSGALIQREHTGWLTDTALFDKSQGKRSTWRMDAFYRAVRKELDILMEDGSPIGGKYSYDAHNREPWRGTPRAPTPPTFPVDDIDEEVAALIEEVFPTHPGCVDLEHLPSTRADALALWGWAKTTCMEHFGPYEDAMSSRSRTLFHTLLSPVLNLHRITPKHVLDEVLELDIPIASKEGFVRQLIGWREFIRHVHVKTNGLRELPNRPVQPDIEHAPGDAGWARYTHNAWSRPTGDEDLVGGSGANALEASNTLPPAFWGERSGLHCLDRVVSSVMQTGYSHHIERLMVLSNIATLLDIEPRQLTDWFWAAYIDAFDWVVEPNVIGMGTFGVGDLFTTKPYISGANYINKMSDFCADCAFSPTKSCPITSLYWAFLARHQDTLDINNRMGLAYKNLGRRTQDKRDYDVTTFEHVTTELAAGRALSPDTMPKKPGQLL